MGRASGRPIDQRRENSLRASRSQRAAQECRPSAAAAVRNTSAGIVLYRLCGGQVEVLLAHPGGPFWKHKDAGAWTIPKGLMDPGEEPLAAARREFAEETGLQPPGPFLPLGSVRQKAGKVVHAYACCGDADASQLASNLVLNQPGRGAPFPEIDRYGWFQADEAKRKLNPAQAELIDRLVAALTQMPPAGSSC